MIGVALLRGLWLPLWMRWKTFSYSMKGLRIGKNPSIRKSVEISKQATIGDNVNIGENVKIKGKVSIGNNVFVNDGCYLFAPAQVTIEDGVTFGPFAFVVSGDHNLYNTRQDGAKAPVKIGKNSYIGAHAIILKGVTIGENSTIGAGSVVTHNIAPFTVAAGNPAKEIRKLKGIKK